MKKHIQILGLAVSIIILLSCSQSRVIGDLSELGRGVPVPIDSVTLYITPNPIRIWRVYDTLRPWSKTGRWWSLELPGESIEEYRKSMAICPEWSECTGLVTGIIRRGEPIIIGTTSEVVCDTVQYGDTSVIQVFIPDTRSIKRVKVRKTTWQ